VAGETILIIDDRAKLRQFLLEAALLPAGFKPLVSDSLEAGLALVSETPCDAVVLAAHLLSPDQPEALRPLALRQPVLLLWSSPGEAGAVHAWKAGARGILVEPLTAEAVLAALGQALAESRLRCQRDDLAGQLAQSRRQAEWQLQELNAIYTMSKTATARLDMERVLAQVVEAATHLARGEEGRLMLLDEATGALYLRAAIHPHEQATGGQRVLVQDALAERVIRFGRPVMMAGPVLQSGINPPGHALLYVPLQVPPERILGVLSVARHSTERAFTERDMFLLSALGNYAAIAIENARLFATLETERGTLAAVLQGTEDAVILLDMDRRVLLCNSSARKAFGLDAGDLAGRPLAEVARSQVLLDLFEHLPIVGRSLRTEVQVGEGGVLQAQLSAIASVGYAVVLQDITHLKNLDRIKNEFVSAISHDLRSPLTTIRGYVDLLPRVGPLTQQQAVFVSRISQSMKTVTDLIGDLLDISRIEAGMDQDVTVCRMDDIAQRAADTVQVQMDEKHHALTVEVELDLPLVMGSARRLEQAMVNLLNNASKYTPDGGKIRMVVRAAGAFVLASVSDNGIGIPLEDQPRVFEKFYRVQNAATANIIGTGLGLSIVKTVVEKHGGRVWVESAPGQGSTFSMLLPAHK